MLCGVVTFYQKTLSPDHGIFKKPYGHCRFYPTCSEYAKQALGKYGACRGIGKSLKRLIKCHPFHEPGHDPVE